MTSITNVRKSTQKLVCKHKKMQTVVEVSDVFTHCLRTADAVSPRFPLLRFAAMMHDIGKVPTRTVNLKTEDFKFYNHEVAGEYLVKNICDRFGCNNKEQDYISKIVRHHMYIVDDSTKIKTIQRWMRHNPYYRDNLRLRIADRKGNLAKSEKPLLTYHLKNLIQQIRTIEKTKLDDKTEIVELNINGEDLINLGLIPGPIFKKIFMYLVEEVKKSPELNTHSLLIEKTKEFLNILEKDNEHSTTKEVEIRSTSNIHKRTRKKIT